MPQPASGPRQTSLWRNRAFLLLWAGQSVSELGSAVTVLLLPATAVTVLRASTFQVGLLTAASTAAFLLIALPAGAVVDRVHKRRLMVGCDIARGVLIASVPLAAVLGVLSLAQLYLVALSAGVLTVFFDVAYQSYLPELLSRGQLIEGNGKLGASQSLAQVIGPGAGGALAGLLGAAQAMTADAVSFAASVASLLLIRAPEPRPPAAQADGEPRSCLRAQLTGGLSFVLRHPVLRKVAATTGTANLFSAMTVALEMVFLIRVLHVTVASAGLLVALASLGGVAGGILSGPLTRWIGSARIIWVSILGFGEVGLLVPLAAPGWRLALFSVGWGGFAFSGVLYNVAQVSYRQAICPPGLLGRMNAAIRWVVWGTLPLGAVIGGALGAVIGVRATLWIAVTGAWGAGFWVFFSPLRTMRDVPALPGPVPEPGVRSGAAPPPSA